jgi:hypothetical protein
MIPLSSSLYPGHSVIPASQRCSNGPSPGLPFQQDSLVYKRCDGFMQQLAKVVSWCMTT